MSLTENEIDETWVRLISFHRKLNLLLESNKLQNFLDFYLSNE